MNHTEQWIWLPERIYKNEQTTVYSGFNKNNTDLVVDKKTLDEYVELFVNYKLKVAAAKDAQLDTVSSFIKEVADYRSQQAEEYLIDSAFIEDQARKTYQATADQI